MQHSNDVYQIYLEQMQALNIFRKDYQSVYSTPSLDQNDPELKRLTEAIAYCCAHAQSTGQQTIKSYHQSLVAQIHPYIVTPLPAKTMLKLSPQNVKERFNIEKGSAFVLEAEEGGNALFKTCMAMQVLPMHYHSFSNHQEGHNQAVLTLTFNAFETMTQLQGEFSLYLNADNDFKRTLALYNALKNSDLAPQVYFDDELVPKQCELDFREPELPHGMHPIEGCRNILHFPYGQFFLYIKLIEQPKTWQSFTLKLKIKKSDYSNTLYKDCFEPFCVPIINLREEYAKGIWVDGLLSRYSIDAPDLGQDLALHSITGVYQKHDDCIEPMIPSVIKSGSNTFSFSYSGLSSEAGQGTTIELNIPEAFEQPRNISVDACWHQPNFSQCFWQNIKVTPFDIDIPGVNWGITEARQGYKSRLLGNDNSNNSLPMFDVLAINGHYHVSSSQLNQLFYLFCDEWAQEFHCIKEGFMGFNATTHLNEFEIVLKISADEMPIAMLWNRYFQIIVNAWFETQDCQLTVKSFFNS